MSKRLYEVARDLGLSSTELTARIEGLDLSFDVQNHLSVIEDGQVDELHRVLNKAPTGGERVEKVVNDGVKRRRSRRKVIAPGDDGEATITTIDGVTAAEAAQDAPEAPVEADASVLAEEDAAPPVRRRPKMETVVTREPVAESAPEAEAVAVETATDEEAVAPKRQRFETVHTESGAQAAAEADVEAAVEKPRSRFETVVTDSGATARAAQPNADQLSGLRQREADARAARPTGGARVVGTMNPDLLNMRLEAEKKDFGPGPKRKDKAKGGKRVVQSRELYTGTMRRNRRGKVKQSGPSQKTQITQAAEHKRVVKMEETIIVGDLAHQMGVKGGELAMKLMFDLGIKGANINTAIDFDTAQLLAEIYEFKIEQVGFDIEKYLPTIEEAEDAQKHRPPVVTIMGHVDHGKTSLLDAIRNEAVAAGEAGGITQHIGAYTVELEAGRICFLDTPGHEAFTALRARGAVATDVVVLVVAADDGVMPQTVEAINHARDADVPIIVAVNKCDKENANPERVRQALTEYELISEEWGGQTLFVNVSALTHEGIPTLLELLALQAELLELTADHDRPATGLVIESKLDVGRGPVATALVQAGTMRPGDIVVAGEFYGRVRTMTDYQGKIREDASPSTPVEITGLNGVPQAGETFYVVDDVEAAKTIAEHIGRQARQGELAASVAATGGVEAIGEFMKSEEIKELKIVVKADVRGSVEAINGALQKLSTGKVAVRVIHSAVGSITENDVNLAASRDEGVRVVVIGFNVRLDGRAQSLAEQLGVLVITESIIYDITDKVKRLMTGMLEPVYEEEVTGHAEVRAIFSVPKVGTVAGCMVTDGHIERNGKARVLRGGEVMYTSEIGSLKHFEKNVPEVKTGFECGLSVERVNDLQVGDVVECFRMKEMQATL